MSEYEYANRNLLDEPYHYMYTPFEGVSLLRAYLASRHTLRDSLMARLAVRRGDMSQASEEVLLAWVWSSLRGANPKYGPEAIQALKKRAFGVLPARPGDGQFKTHTVLIDVFQEVLCNTGVATERMQEWIDFFLRNYEVTKRLYVAYGSDLKPTERSFASLENYALLAGLLLCVHQGSPNYKYLNCALKLGDLLSSVGDRTLNSPAVELIAATMEVETAGIERLAEHHKIQL